jgi:hypothetical protein
MGLEKETQVLLNRNWFRWERGMASRSPHIAPPNSVSLHKVLSTADSGIVIQCEQWFIRNAVTAESITYDESIATCQPVVRGARMVMATEICEADRSNANFLRIIVLCMDDSCHPRSDTEE